MQFDQARRERPRWIRARLPAGENYTDLKERFRALSLHTVCEEARCPNIGECWNAGTATLMLLGDTCTRGCRFCAVRKSKSPGPVDAHEPEKVALALSEMNLAYVVLTMVDRDDLPDGGAEHVARTVRSIKERCPDLLVETLVSDFAGSRRDVEAVVQQGRPDVYAHNVEVVPRLQRVMRDQRCSWERSTQVLMWAREAGANVIKSSLMLGCGESKDEVLDAMRRLRDAGVDVVTLGQYLPPTPKHAPLERFVAPDEFDFYGEAGREMGFRFVASGPLVRSSYRAAEAFLLGTLRGAPPPYDDAYGKKRHLRVVS